MIKAETGMPTPLKELEQQCDKMVEAWKTVTFPVAWKYLEGCQQAVYDPGYVVNPWGFRKTFHVRPGTVRRDFEREAGNFPEHWSGEVKWGEFRGSLNLVDNSSLLCYNELCRKVILIQALQECSEGATTRTRVQTGQ